MEYERVELPQPHYGPTSAYRIGNTLVDTGHVCEESRERLRYELDGGRLDGIERVVITHPHIDHVGGSLTLPELSTLPHVVYQGAEDLLRSYADYLAEARRETREFAAGLVTDETGRAAQRASNDQYFPLDIEYADDELNIERIVGPGDTVRVGAYDCEVVHTPGHSHQHMALHHTASNVMLSGDIVSTNGHFMYGPVYWDIGEYKTGLRRIRALEPAVLLPGHGEPMADPNARVDDALVKAERAEAAILKAVETRGPLAAHELAIEALGASDAAVGFLTNVASVYAIHLAERGLLDVERRPDVVARPVS